MSPMLLDNGIQLHKKHPFSYFPADVFHGLQRKCFARFVKYFVYFKMLWRCAICLGFLSFSLKLLLSHINRMHSRSPDFRLLCGIDGCTEVYRVYNSFYHHVKRRHSQHLLESTRAGDSNHAGQQPQEEGQGTHQQQVSKVS